MDRATILKFGKLFDLATYVTCNIRENFSLQGTAGDE